MDTAAIGSGAEEGRGGSEIEAGVAEGMAEWTKKDHINYMYHDVCMYQDCTEVVVKDKYGYGLQAQQARMQGRKKRSRIIGPFHMVTTLL